MKPIAWYDPSNGMVSTDQHCPLFTPLGQVWSLVPEKDNQREIENLKSGYGPVNLLRRLEAGIPADYGYKAGDFYRLRSRKWVGLSDEEIRLQWSAFWETECHPWAIDFANAIVAKLKEKNQ